MGGEKRKERERGRDGNGEEGEEKKKTFLLKAFGVSEFYWCYSKGQSIAVKCAKCWLCFAYRMTLMGFFSGSPVSYSFQVHPSLANEQINVFEDFRKKCLKLFY